MAQPKRRLPDEQIPDGEIKPDNDAALMPMERAQEIADRLTDVERATNSDGTITGQVTAIDTTKNNNRFAVTVTIPPGREKTFYLEKPRIWTEDYEFVRFMEYYGYTASSTAAMIRDNVKVEVMIEDGEYELFVPPAPQYRESIMNHAKRWASGDAARRFGYAVAASGAFVFLPLTVILGAVAGIYHVGQANDADGVEIVLHSMIYILLCFVGLMIWSVVVAAPMGWVTLTK